MRIQIKVFYRGSKIGVCTTKTVSYSPADEVCAGKLLYDAIKTWLYSPILLYRPHDSIRWWKLGHVSGVNEGDSNFEDESRLDREHIVI